MMFGVWNYKILKYLNEKNTKGEKNLTIEIKYITSVTLINILLFINTHENISHELPKKGDISILMMFINKKYID